MFILLFFSFSKSQILNSIIQYKSTEKNSEKIIKGKKGRKTKGLKNLIKNFSTEKYGKNYSFLFSEDINIGKQNSESETKNKAEIDKTTELSQGGELLINELEKK